MKLLLTTLIALLAFPAFAADGDKCDIVAVPISVQDKGTWRTDVCIDVCDANVAADSDCTEFDFKAQYGLPDTLIFEIQDNDGNCSGTPAIAVTTGPVTGGTPSYEISTTAVIIDDNPNRVVVDTQAAALSRFLFFAVSGDAGCTDLDLRMFLVNRKN